MYNHQIYIFYLYVFCCCCMMAKWPTTAISFLIFCPKISLNKFHCTMILERFPHPPVPNYFLQIHSKDTSPKWYFSPLRSNWHKNSRIWETMNLSTCADSSNHIKKMSCVPCPLSPVTCHMSHIFWPQLYAALSAMKVPGLREVWWLIEQKNR